jgi:hypothetical protein
MSQYDQGLIRIILTQVGVAPGEPTPEQLNKIKNELRSIINSGRKISHVEFRDVVLKYCRKGLLLALDSVDNSDLDTILMLALKATPKR